MSKSKLCFWRLDIAVAVLALLAAGIVSLAGGKLSAAEPSAPAPQSVEMFAAMKNGDIEVKLIPKNDREARVFLKNNTKRPLTVRLPDAFAGVPVLAQAAGGKRGGGGAAGGANQGMGGGMGGGGMGGGGMGGGGMGGGGGGGGFFNVPAEKVAQFKVETVCLEHGKKDPRPAIPYEIRPIESLSSRPAVQELCKLLGLGGIDQRAAQAAAWHLNNDMTWEELNAKEIPHLSGPNEPYFTQDQLRTAVSLANTAIDQAAQRPKDAPSIAPTSSGGTGK